MKMLGNSLRDLEPIQKRHLYLLKVLRKMQRRAALCITEVFHTSLDIEAIAGLIPIYLHFVRCYLHWR